MVSAAPLLLPAFATVWLATGGGGFRSDRNPIVVGGRSMGVGDFDGDRKLDLVVTTQTGVDVLLGNGDGIATANLSVHPPSRSAVVAGYVRVCGGPAPGRCSKRVVHICTPAGGCVTSDRVAAVNARGRVAAVQRLKKDRFRMRLAPGRYTIELLADGRHVHRRVLQHRKVNAGSHRTAIVPFLFAFP